MIVIGGNSISIALTQPLFVISRMYVPGSLERVHDEKLVDKAWDLLWVHKEGLQDLQDMKHLDLQDLDEQDGDEEDFSCTRSGSRLR